MASPAFVDVPASVAGALRDLVGAQNVITDTDGVETLSKDYYWYSPVLRERLETRRASAAVKVRTLDELRAVIAIATKARLPITLRGAATGNYGQCIPLFGGLVVDLSGMDKIRSIADGVVTAEPGARLGMIEQAARTLGWELRCYPSTWVKATIGGFIGGGSGGIGSISWGGLRDLGTIKSLTILTIEESPRLLTLEGPDTLQAFHAYGTNGIMVELQMRLAPARRWDQIILASESWDALLDFTHALALDDTIPKRLVSVMENPIPSFFKPIKKFYPADRHVTFLEIDDAHSATVVARALSAGLQVPHTIPHHEPRRSPMLSDYTWNHTTLWAINTDPAFTYLQSGFGENFREQFAALHARFPGEILFHLEFMRGNSKMGVFGKVMCGGIPLVRFTTEARLREIIDYCTEIGVFTANPHTCYVEEGGRDFGFDIQRALKATADPFGLLNPGKMKSHPLNPFVNGEPAALPRFLTA